MPYDPFRFYNAPTPAPTYFAGTLPAVDIVADEYQQYPYYSGLTNEEKKFFGSNTPIGRAVRAKAQTGKVGQTYNDLSRVAKTFERFGAEMTGIPGSIRFSRNPSENLGGALRTFEKTIIGSAPGIPQGAVPYDSKEVEGLFNTLDAAGVLSTAVAPLRMGLTASRVIPASPLKNAYKYNPFANQKVPLNKLYHKSNNPNLSLEDIDLFRIGESQSKKRFLDMPESERPAGFYTSDEAFYPFMGGRSKYSFDFPANAKIKDLSAEGRITDRISQSELKKLQKEGYDIIKGKNMIGQTEYIPLNKSMMSGWKFEGTAGTSTNTGIPGTADNSVFSHLEPLRDVRFQSVKPHWWRGFDKTNKGQPFSRATVDDVGERLLYVFPTAASYGPGRFYNSRRLQ